MLACAIVNGTVISDGTRLTADVGVEADRIAEVAKPGTLGLARRTIDAAGCYVLPGAVDIHFHCRAPSHPERGDFASETGAAAAGGVTTIFEMPISDPACSTPEVLTARRELGERDCRVNFALYAGGAVRDAATAEALVDAGAIGFKIFTTTPAPAREHEFKGLSAAGEEAIYTALQAISGTGRRVVFHAENQALIEYFARRLSNGVPERPSLIEAVQIGIVGAIARELRTPVHIAHVTSAAGLDAVRAAQHISAPLSAETCPQYLLFTEAEVQRVGAFAKIAPPLRTVADTEALWAGLRDGSLAVVASDHSPFRPEEKTSVPFAQAPFGMPTVELMIPMLLDAGQRGRIPLEMAVDLVTAAPARLFDLFPRKGAVAVGSDADIVVYAPSQTNEIRIDRMVSRAAGCAQAFDGMTFRGTITHTLVNGNVVYENGAILDGPPGRFVGPRNAAAAVPARASL
jgi:dihydroorotase (multifunctional complex type)